MTMETVRIVGPDTWVMALEMALGGGWTQLLCYKFVAHRPEIIIDMISGFLSTPGRVRLIASRTSCLALMLVGCRGSVMVIPSELAALC